MKEKLLLLHGALGSQDQMAAIGEFLKSKYEVINLNFSGHGGKAQDQSFSIEGFSKDVLDVLNEKSINRTHVFGYSMGGYVALYTARHFGSHIGKVVTLGTKFDWTMETAEKENKMLDPDKIELKVPKFAEHLSRQHGRDRWKKVVRQTATMMLGLAEGGKMKAEDFEAIEQEVVIGRGEDDAMVSKAESMEVAELLPNGSFTSLPGVQHVIDKEDPEVIARYIRTSLQ